MVLVSEAVLSWIPASTGLAADWIKLGLGGPPKASKYLKLFRPQILRQSSSNCAKLFEGGWFPLLLTSLVEFLMLTWRKGGTRLAELHNKLRQPEDSFCAAMRADPPIRVPGAAAVFGTTTGIPLALAHHLKHNHVMHERVLLVSTHTTETPEVAPEQRAKISAMVSRCA